MSTLTDADVQQRLQGLAGWEHEGNTIVCERRFADFAEAIAFVDRVAERSEAANHHPDILLHGWNKVRLTLSTHSQGGLTEADFRLAGEIDGLA